MKDAKNWSTEQTEKVRKPQMLVLEVACKSKQEAINLKGCLKYVFHGMNNFRYHFKSSKKPYHFEVKPITDEIRKKLSEHK